MDKVFYNEASAARLLWTPQWFGATEFDEELVKKIIQFQKSIGVQADGLCGPNTFRRIWAHREANLDKYEPSSLSKDGQKQLVYRNSFYPINWGNVILPYEKGGSEFRKGFRKVFEPREINFGVTHWDAALSAESCVNILKRRGLSIHFPIDNDGCIRQHMDMNYVAFHAGSKKWNNRSIGVEISNAYYPKYQKWYKKNVGEERPMVEGAKVHGSELDPFTGFYPVQLEALKALWTAVSEICDIPLKSPTARTTHRSAVSGTYKGFVHHYHLTKNKIDCAGLDLNELFNK